MKILDTLKGLFDGLLAFGQDGNWKMLIMWVIGATLIYLAIKKEMEPTLLLPIGFGAILMNFPGVVVFNEAGEIVSVAGIAEPLETLYHAGIISELFPLLLFIYLPFHYTSSVTKGATFPSKQRGRLFVNTFFGIFSFFIRQIFY